MGGDGGAVPPTPGATLVNSPASATRARRPKNAEIVVHTGDQSIEESAQAVLDFLASKGLIAAAKVAN